MRPVARCRPIAHAAGCLLAIGVLLLAPSRPAHAGVRTAIEKLIGRQTATALAEGFGTETDPVLTAWVARIGQRVAAVSPRQDVRYRIAIVAMDEPNALALPGGYIFVTRGLLEFVQDDDELAAIIAHEVGHVAGHHGMRHLEYQLLASLLISGVQRRAGDLAATTLGLADALFALQRSRRDELAADRMGLEFAARAGYDPEGLLRFFEKIRPGKKPSWLDRLFATHPEPETRIARAKTNLYVQNPPAEVLIAIGDRLASEGRFHRAIMKYRAAIDRRPGDATASARLASALAARGQQPGGNGAALGPGAPEAAEGRRYPPGETEQARQALLATQRDLGERERQFNSLGQKVQRDLRRAWSRHEWTQRLQAGLAGLPQGLDTRWVYVATRCLVLSAETDALIKSAWRATRHGNGAIAQASSVCLLAARDPALDGILSRQLLAETACEMERAGKEILQSAAEVDRSLPGLAEADRLVAGVLADLNAPHVVRWPSTWGHLAALEAVLQQAERCLSQARQGIGAALDDAARARARAERSAIDLACATARPQEAALFRRLLCSRLEVSNETVQSVMDRGYSLGDAAVLLLYTRSTGKPLASLEAACQGNATLIETAEKLGLPVHVQAIVLRLLNNTIAEERARD